jgi:hypothetical protein
MVFYSVYAWWCAALLVKVNVIQFIHTKINIYRIMQTGCWLHVNFNNISAEILRMNEVSESNGHINPSA